MTEQELINSIHSVAESMANTFSSYSRDVLEAFADERKEARAMLRDITVSSEKRLERANVMVTQFSNSADSLSKMATLISTEYASHIKKLTDERDKLLGMVDECHKYIKVLQEKVDDRDEHIKSLLVQNAQLIQRMTAAPQAPLVHNSFVPGQ